MAQGITRPWRASISGVELAGIEIAQERAAPARLEPRNRLMFMAASDFLRQGELLPLAAVSHGSNEFARRIPHVRNAARLDTANTAHEQAVAAQNDAQNRLDGAALRTGLCIEYTGLALFSTLAVADTAAVAMAGTSHSTYVASEHNVLLPQEPLPVAPAIVFGLCTAAMYPAIALAKLGHRMTETAVAAADNLEAAQMVTTGAANRRDGARRDALHAYETGEGMDRARVMANGWPYAAAVHAPLPSDDESVRPVEFNAAATRLAAAESGKARDDIVRIRIDN